MNFAVIYVVCSTYFVYHVAAFCDPEQDRLHPSKFMASPLSDEQTSAQDKYLQTQCPDFLEAGNSNIYTKQLNFMITNSSDAHQAPDPFLITLISQFSYRKMKLVEPLIKNWGGPAILTFYGTTSEGKKLKSFVESSPALSNSNTIFQFVHRRGELYPFNILRNVALKTVTTPFVFMVDVDFVTQPDLHRIAREDLSRLHDLYPQQTAYVVAAFRAGTNDSAIVPETLQEFPNNKQELIKLWDSKKLTPFAHEGWPPEERNTDYLRWKMATKSYAAAYEDHYEPWVILETRTAPLYDERFVGYGYDKASYNFELAARGYQFVVLPEEFMVHLPHAQTPPEKLFRSGLQLIEYCRRLLRGFFYRDIGIRYGDASNALLSVVPRCCVIDDVTGEELLLPCAY